MSDGGFEDRARRAATDLLGAIGRDEVGGFVALIDHGQMIAQLDPVAAATLGATLSAMAATCRGEIIA